jgi:hypothetical protein
MIQRTLELPKNHSFFLFGARGTEGGVDHKTIQSQNFEKDFPKAEFFCVSRVKNAQKIGKIWILPWQEFFKSFYLKR